MTSISILGSGWLGLPLAHALQQAGYNIRTSTRSPERQTEIQKSGIETYLYDIEILNQPRFADNASIMNHPDFLQGDILIINITNKNIEAFKALITQIERSSIRKVLFISSTSVYADSAELNPDPITEDDLSALKPCPLLDIENLLRYQQHFETSIIRLSGLIGYQRHPGRFFLQRYDNQELSCKPIRNPDGYVNLIHRDDCIGIIQALLKQDSWGEIFNGCSSQHPTRREFYTWAIADYYDKENIDRNNSTKDSIEINFVTTDVQSYKIIDNSKVKSHLAYVFKQGDLLAQIPTSE